jgi:hypothetical protein
MDPLAQAIGTDNYQSSLQKLLCAYGSLKFVVSADLGFSKMLRIPSRLECILGFRIV